MRLTAMDINNKEFKKSVSGYNRDEVDEFLDKIREDYEALYKDNSVLQEKIGVMTEKIEHYTKIEATIQSTLMLAQNAAEQSKIQAQKESEFIIKNANETASKVLEKAHNDISMVQEDYQRLKEDFIRFRVKYKNFIKAQLDTFEDLEKELVSDHFQVKNDEKVSVAKEETKNQNNVIENKKNNDVHLNNPSKKQNSNKKENVIESVKSEKDFGIDDTESIKSFFVNE